MLGFWWWDVGLGWWYLVGCFRRCSVCWLGIGCFRLLFLGFVLVLVLVWCFGNVGVWFCDWWVVSLVGSW